MATVQKEKTEVGSCLLPYKRLVIVGSEPSECRDAEA